MKISHFFILIGSIFFATSCDDGDIIVNEFEFDVNDIDFCNVNNNSVLFNINDLNETIAIAMDQSFLDTIENNIERPIDSKTQVFYRKFNSRITSSYFCSTIPLNNVGIQTELIGDRGEVIIVTERTLDLTPEGDIDNDGLTNLQEGYIENAEDDEQIDTDEDGVPDYLDEDDDNDNVKTSVEIRDPENPDSTEFPNNDTDDLPDYLDPDDDGDGTPTRNEVKEGESSPLNNSNDTNGEKVFNYLNNQINTSFENNNYLENTITSTFTTNITIVNLGLSNGENTVIRDELPFGLIVKSKPETSKTPFVIELEEEDDDDDNDPPN